MTSLLHQHSGDWSDSDFEEHLAICYELDINPTSLLAVEMSESGCVASAHNPNGNATGLIQFMPATLQGLGWHEGWEAFSKVGVTGQIPYVRRYLLPHRGQLKNTALVYAAIFLPAVLSWKDLGPTTIICSARGPFAFAYMPNRVFDRDAKGYITLEDLETQVMRQCSGARWLELSGRLRNAIASAETPVEVAVVTDENRPVILCPPLPFDVLDSDYPSSAPPGPRDDEK